MPATEQLTSAPRPSNNPAASGAATSTESAGHELATEAELEQQTMITERSGDEEEALPPRHEPKISTPVGFLLLSYTLILDTIGIILIFLALDDFLILDILGTPTNLYFLFKGMKATRSTITTLLELIPYIGVLPLKTIGVAMTLYADRHPEAVEKLGVLSGRLGAK